MTVESRGHRLSWAAGAIVASAGLSTAACREPTQVTFEVRTDVPCNLLQKTTITVGAPDETENQRDPTTVSSACVGGLVGSLVTVPSSSKSARLSIRVVTGVDREATQCGADTQYKGCIVARRRLAYVPHTPLFVPISMNLSCKDVPCDVRSTCNRLGRCVPADVDPEECAKAGGCSIAGEGPQADAGVDATMGEAGADARAADSGSDASPDAPSDAPIDARNSGEAGSGAGRIQCPGSADCVAPQHCCFDTVRAVGGCAPSQVGCAFGGNDVDLRCDGREDCTGGEVCCYTPSFGSSCVPGAGNCVGGDLLCTDSAQCSATCGASTLPAPFKACR